MPLVAGVDVSTQSTKVVVVDTEDGRVMASASAPHDVTGSRGARESDPDRWEDGVASCLAQCGLATDVGAISVAAQQHGLVAVGADGRPLRPALLWNDTRSACEARDLVDALGGPDATAKLMGSVPSASFTVTKWAWLRAHEPDTVAATEGIRLPHDYLTGLLCGRAVTDRSDVSGTGWWSPGDERYSETVLGLAGVELSDRLLPEVLAPDEAAGTVTARGADRFGLPTTALVAGGAGDNAAAGLALGLRPGEAAMSLGTSGTVFALADRPSADPSGIVAGFASADGRHLPLACTLNATLAVDRVASWLGCGREDVAPSDGVVCLPWLDGERTPNAPDATGTVSGLRHDTKAGAILQAAYEGVVATLLAATDTLAEWAPQRADQPIVLLGGGARGPVWQEVVGRLSGRPILVSAVAEPVAYGAAIQAAAVLTGRSSREVSHDWLHSRGTELAAVRRDDAVLEALAAWRGRVLAP